MSDAIRKKLVIVGDGACGKTCLLIRFADNSFPEEYVPTVFETYTKDIVIDGRYTVALTLWDTAGQEGFDRLRPLSYADGHVVLICFAIDTPYTLENVEEHWHTEVIQHHSHHFLLIGCKKDLRFDGGTIARLAKENPPLKPVTSEAGEALATKIGAYKYLECSAKTGEGVNAVFEHATRAALASRGGGRRRREGGKEKCVLL
ncbi:GTP-binding protein rho1 [Cladochytrium replicatum]|nr:GTP-binding protein rho1 [Cladochytrium replicatum]